MLKKIPKFPIQYISDIHVNYRNYRPLKFNNCEKYLIVCGDVGDPNHKNWNDFIKYTSDSFHKVFFIAGNHDYHCDCRFDHNKYNYWNNKLIENCSKYKNVHYLDCNSYYLKDEQIKIIGCTLWSSANDIHQKHVNFIKQELNKKEPTENQSSIVATHFCPTYKLMEDKYKDRKNIHLFFTDLEYLFMNPLKAWICGHTHSRLEIEINNIYCGVNAHFNT